MLILVIAIAIAIVFAPAVVFATRNRFFLIQTPTATRMYVVVALVVYSFHFVRLQYDPCAYAVCLCQSYVPDTQAMRDNIANNNQISETRSLRAATAETY